MDNDNNQKSERSERIVTVLSAQKAVKALSNPNSPWTLTQEILQEIQASFIVSDPDKHHPVTELAEKLREEIGIRYSNDPDMKELLLNSIPNLDNLRKSWLKKEGWEEAVWKKIRSENLFSPEKRSQVIESLRTRAIDPKRPSDQAAKIWLTLSGDYSEKMEVTDKSLDAYREINSILHKKKSSE